MMVHTYNGTYNAMKPENKIFLLLYSFASITLHFWY